MTGFIVEKEPETSRPASTIPMPGLKKLGYKGVESTELVFDGFRTPASSVLGGEAGIGQGFKYFMSGIEVGRVNVAARGRRGSRRPRSTTRCATRRSARRSASRSASTRRCS